MINPLNTEGFKKWFQGSKVVDKNNNPLRVYHGTQEIFSKFDKIKSGGYGRKLPKFWFTSDTDIASDYAKYNPYKQNNNVIPLYVSIKNPIDWEKYLSVDDNYIQQHGYDGVLHWNSKGDVAGACFSPNQLKSAISNKTFNSDDDDITKEEVDSVAITNNQSLFSSDFINFIKKIENSQKNGYKNEKWYPVKSPEGGFPTIGYGHKIKNKNELQSFSNGITDEQSNKLLIQDLEIAKKHVYNYIKSNYNVNLKLSQKQEEILTEFAFNLGSLDKFPKFVKAVLYNDWNVAKQEYKRSYTVKGKRIELTNRNQDFYNRYLKENKLSSYNRNKQAILTNNPIQLHFGKFSEGSHIEILLRIYPQLEKEIQDTYMSHFNTDNDGVDEGELKYEISNDFCKKYNIVRIIIENGELVFNTASDRPLTNNQLKYLKDYCIENNLKLFHSTGSIGMNTNCKQIELNENLKLTVKNMIVEGVKEKAIEDFIQKIIKGTEWEGKVFIAGGYVRDELRGDDPKDMDLLVNSPNGGVEFSKWITQKIGAYKEGSNPVIASSYGTAAFQLRGVSHNGVDLSDYTIEAVMPRKEKYDDPNSRNPTVSQGTLPDDVERRDFTVNSLLKNLSTGEILDLTGMGKSDIEKGIVRTKIDPDQIFKDDPLRMLRAVRFAVKYNWKLPMFMIRSIKKNASRLKIISKERIRDELNKILVTKHPSKGIKMIKTVGIMPYVIPDLLPAIKMLQNIHHKHDVFTHTLEVLSKTQPILIRRLMALFHDIGKTVTRTVTPSGVHFYGHEEEGAKIAEKIMRDLKYPNEITQAVVSGVKNHMRLKSAGDDAINVSDKTLRKFRAEMGEQLENILDVIHADNISHSEASSMPNQIQSIKNRLSKLEAVKAKPELPINGNDLMSMGLKPGPIFSKILGAITDAWYENPKISKEEAINIVKKMI